MIASNTFWNKLLIVNSAVINKKDDKIQVLVFKFSLNEMTKKYMPFKVSYSFKTMSFVRKQ